MTGVDEAASDSTDGVLDRLATAVVELDAAQRVRLMNTAAEQCLGSSRRRLDGAPLAQVYGVPGAVVEAVTLTAEDRQPRHVRECRMAGGIYDCGIHALPVNGVMLEFHETEWDQRRQQLEQRELQTGLMDLLRRNLGHEIRNPLGGIRGAAQMLDEELEDEELRPLARLVIREADRIDELMGRFGQPRLQRGRCDIHQVIDEAIDLLRLESGGHLAIVQDYDPSIPALAADPGALRQVVLNLMMNALQAGAATVRARTRVEHGHALLQPGQLGLLRVDIEDDGAGVPEKIRSLLFLPMVTGRRDGTGLGLALAQQIAAAHDGLLSYRPREQGSRFTLRLPLERTDD